MPSSPGAATPGATGRETPIRRQYQALKDEHPDCVLLFQLGDFFESFEEDARTVAAICGVTLTSREFGKGDRVALAGVPITRLEHYLARLIEAGRHVAIAEQVSPPGAGLVERAVTRVVTPGTLVEPGLLQDKENNYLAAVVRGHGAVGLAYVDVSTGEFAATQLDGEDLDARLRAELERLAPAELLVPTGQDVDAPRPGHTTICQPWRFHESTARERLCAQLGVLSLEGFGCAGLPLAIGAAGAILAYVEETNRRLLPNLASLRTYSTAAGMVLDSSTRRNLELLRNGRGGRLDGSLLSVLDRTRTPMGGRLLRQWISRPLLDLAAIDRRLDAVATLTRDDGLRWQVRELLARVGDLERLVGRVAQGVAGPRELLALAESLRSAARLRALAADERPNSPEQPDTTDWEPDAVDDGADRSDQPADRSSPGVLGLADVDPCPEVVDLVARAVAPPGSGRLVAPGFSPELDDLIATVTDSRRWVADLEQVERERTGIRSLKVGYNKVFGYYLEVTRPNLPQVPLHYERRQTLVLAERFVTPDLKAQEARILKAEEHAEELERTVFGDVLEQVDSHGPRLRRLAQALAHLDVVAALADVARDRGYCRPTLDESGDICVVAARHPVVESRLDPGAFIPNDCRLGTDDQQVMLLTGPNMAGKSTYLRQVALIALMAQIGSFVPADKARIGLVDRIFTRVGAQDDIAAGASTFMVEMMETATILRHATGRSLVVLDEIGRGTSTYDGLAIARAVVEEVHERVGARTLFATHFHELAGLADELPRLAVYNVAVAEEANDVVFLRNVVPGAARRSYGIHVARLAGLPERVTTRARDILVELESVPAGDAPVPEGNGAIHPRQLTLAGFPRGVAGPGEILTELATLDLNTLTPVAALAKLADLQKRAGCA